ncbi:MAG: MBL fold metallo-hydrolase [Alphaproteobacteria bacterium]|nr:MBL fold metallo-hydrolase [Alphaproteobacteria bacterium]
MKSTIKAEPLIWKWYAWSYLISPATAACNIVDRHLKIMQSYVQNPQIHAQAVKDPKMLGGPFVDLEGQQVNEIKDLIIETNKNCAELITLDKGLKELDKIIHSEAKGASLEEFYKRIPNELKGMVELTYDLNNHSSIRLIESLFYKKYYRNNFQEIALSNITTDFRKFLLSTPRLNDKNEVYLNIPFSDKKLDFLFSRKHEPCEIKDLIELFKIPITKQELFSTFFSTIPINRKTDRNHENEGIRIRYFGHACILVQTKSISILFDPIISYSINNDIPRYTFEDLPDQIDFVIITHNHQDHLMFETLLQLRYKTRCVVFPSNQRGALADPSIKLILKHVGFTSVIELNEFENINIEDGEIIGLPFLGEHADLNIQSKLSYYINIKGKKLIFLADSNNLDEYLYDYIFDLVGSIDMLFLGMECAGAPLSWLYGPLLSIPLNRAFDHSRTLSGSDFNKAWSIVKKLRCKHAYVYAMGQEPWLNYITTLNYSPEAPQIIESNKFVSACNANGIISERLFGKKEWLL